VATRVDGVALVASALDAAGQLLHGEAELGRRERPALPVGGDPVPPDAA
jgi:hypothetical protein